MIAVLLAALLGAQLYATHCADCHGTQLEGRHGVRGAAAVPALRGVGAAAVDFALSTGRMPIEVPGTEPVRGLPSFPRDQINALIAYIVAHGGAGPAIPQVHHSDDLTRGRLLFEANCQACHGATGIGSAAGFAWLAPTLRPATALQVAEAVRTGPGIMPRFDANLLPQSDLDALASYVESLRHVDNRGGWAIGSTGPAGEGFVAWIFGLGGIVLLMRRIGERLR